MLLGIIQDLAASDEGILICCLTCNDDSFTPYQVQSRLRFVLWECVYVHQLSAGSSHVCRLQQQQYIEPGLPGS